MKPFIKPFFLLICSFTFIACGTSQEQDSSLQGDFRTTKITDAYIYYRHQPDSGELKKYFEHYQIQNNVRIKDYAKIADYVALVSRCFEIDALFFTGMIRMESSFRSEAVSPTGAAGLTQFTGIGLKEVHDQLGRRGASYARRKTTAYLLKQIDSCILPSLSHLQVWKHLWEFSDPKKKMISDPIYAAVYGAILLKTNLAVVKYKDPSLTSNLPIYKKAFDRYNGDPNPRIRELYVRNIRKYAGEISQFLKQMK